MADMQELIARLEAGPVYLTHKEAYDLAIFFGSDTALGMASVIRKAFAGGSLDAALALAERLGLDGFHTVYAALMNWKAHDPRGPASKTLPLALCIAILKAKAQGDER